MNSPTLSHHFLESDANNFPDKIALVVPADGNLTAEELTRRCAAKLPKHKLPSTIRLLRVLPKKASGKSDRDKCLSIVET